MKPSSPGLFVLLLGALCCIGSQATAAGPATGNPRDFSALSAQVGASVVTIAAVRPFDAGDDEDLEDLRADLLHELSPSSERDAPQPTAVRVHGCGVILSEDGYILTKTETQVSRSPSRSIWPRAWPLS